MSSNWIIRGFLTDIADLGGLVAFCFIRHRTFLDSRTLSCQSNKVNATSSPKAVCRSQRISEVQSNERQAESQI